MMRTKVKSTVADQQKGAITFNRSLKEKAEKQNQRERAKELCRDRERERETEGNRDGRRQLLQFG